MYLLEAKEEKQDDYKFRGEYFENKKKERFLNLLLPGAQTDWKMSELEREKEVDMTMKDNISSDEFMSTSEHMNANKSALN